VTVRGILITSSSVSSKSSFQSSLPDLVIFSAVITTRHGGTLTSQVLQPCLVMEQRNLANKFAQLRLPRVLTGQGTQNTDRLLRFRPSGHNMDQLVQDFNTALAETAGSNSSSISTTSRRKAWKRRCKSTSNLLHAGQNMSEDSSSSVDNVGLLSRDRGTSSLQFSDSDNEVGLGMETELVRSARNRQSRMQEYRNKRGGADHLGIESDSFTENISPFKEFRVNIKRKRKFKRMTVDPSSSDHGMPSTALRPAQGHPGHSGLATKRKKVRSRSGADTRTGGKKGAGGILPGKRKRSAREKSVDSGDIFCSGRSRTASLGEKGLSSMEKMDMEEIWSSSSLSSSEWEDVHTDGGPEGEADDEQSDWPGPEPGMSVMQLTDEEVDPEISFSQLLTGPACNASGRVIRSGSRRLKSHHVYQAGGAHPGIPAYGEQVARFMQDTFSQTLHLPAIKSTDRNMILRLASLYSLSWSPEGESILVLTKTSQTVKPAGASSEFAVPGIPTSRQHQLRERRAKDPKRQRRTPPLPTVLTASEKGERQLSGSKMTIKHSSGSKSN